MNAPLYSVFFDNAQHTGSTLQETSNQTTATVMFSTQSKSHNPNIRSLPFLLRLYGSKIKRSQMVDVFLWKLERFRTGLERFWTGGVVFVSAERTA